MEKPFFERGKQIFRFIYIEKKEYTALLNELKSILYAKKILIVPVGGTGDVLLSIPTFKAVREKYPKNKLIAYEL